MSNLKLYIDARSLCNNIQDGKNIYARELIRSLKNTKPHGVELVLIGDCKNPKIDFSFNRLWHFKVAKIVNNDHDAMFFSPTSFLTACLIQRPSLVTVHDLIAFMHPSQVGFKAAFIENICLRLLNYRSNVQYLTVSDSTKCALKSFFTLPKKKIHSSSIGTLIQGIKTPKKNYFLCLQAMIPRKNQLFLLKAFAEIADQVSNNLILAGYGDPKYIKQLHKFCKANGLEQRVKILGAVSEKQKVELYSQAQCCIFPNLYEGFGMPLIESLKCHTPILTAQIPPFIEVNPNSEAQFELKSPKQLSHIMLHFLKHPKALEDLYAKQKTVLDHYDWTKIAQSFWKILK